MTITHAGFSVQLYLDSKQLSPFDQSSEYEHSIASYAVNTELLSCGKEWAVLWRDDRGSNTGMIVGLVSQLEGDARDVPSNLVGSMVSSEVGQLPRVKGIIRMGIAPLKLQLVLRAGSTSPLPIGSQPLATFELVVYPETGPKNVDGPVNAGSPIYESPSNLTSVAQSPFHDQSPRPALQHQPAYDVTTQLEAQIEELKAELAIERDRSKYFEDAVSTLYRRLPLAEEIAYCQHRLETESLAPLVRISVAVAKQRATEKYEEECKKAVQVEIEGFVEKLRRKQGAGG